MGDTLEADDRAREDQTAAAALRQRRPTSNLSPKTARHFTASTSASRLMSASRKRPEVPKPADATSKPISSHSVALPIASIAASCVKRALRWLSVFTLPERARNWPVTSTTSSPRAMASGRIVEDVSGKACPRRKSPPSHWMIRSEFSTYQIFARWLTPLSYMLALRYRTAICTCAHRAGRWLLMDPKQALACLVDLTLTRGSGLRSRLYPTASGRDDVRAIRRVFILAVVLLGIVGVLPALANTATNDAFVAQTVAQLVAPSSPPDDSPSPTAASSAAPLTSPLPQPSASQDLFSPGGKPKSAPPTRSLGNVPPARGWTLELSPFYESNETGDAIASPATPLLGTGRVDFFIARSLVKRFSMSFREINVDDSIGRIILPTGKVVNPGTNYDLITVSQLSYSVNPFFDVDAGYYRRWRQCCPGAGDPRQTKSVYGGGPFVQLRGRFGTLSKLGRAITLSLQGQEAHRTYNAATVATIAPEQRHNLSPNDVFGTRYNITAQFVPHRASVGAFVAYDKLLLYLSNLNTRPDYATQYTYGLRAVVSRYIGVELSNRSLVNYNDGSFPRGNALHYSLVFLRATYRLNFGP